MDKRRKPVAAVLALAFGALAVVAGSIGTGTAAANGAKVPGPASFTTTIDNPLYPLPPGQMLIYRGLRDGSTQTDRVLVTNRTRVVNGVDTVVVRDIARHGSRLIEKTFDWFAQDDQGNVWYFGENTAEYDAKGHVISTEGSWEAGVDGAVAGIIMEANPQPPDAYRQEYLAGHAEDTAWIVRRGFSVKVPYGTQHRALESLEFTQLEPRVVDEKVYAPGIGIVLERSLAGGLETAELVAVKG